MIEWGGTAQSENRAAASSLRDDFLVCGGSVLGREHVRLHRNNQDGLVLRVGSERLVVAVTDGCSGGAYSEVGARLGARWLAAWLPQYCDVEPDPRSLCAEVGLGLAGYLGRVARGLRPEADIAPADVQDLLLFTFLAAVIEPERTLILGLGDGVFSVNGQKTVLESGAGNAPAYLAYRLVGSSLLKGAPTAFEPVLHHVSATSELDSLLIGTDGCVELIERAHELLTDGGLQGGLEQFERDPRLERNPSLLHKRLVVLGERERRLSDDTTLALVRRKETNR